MSKTTRNSGSYKLLIYSYSSSLCDSNEVKFHYALNGRGKKPGLIETTNSVKISRSVILVPVRSAPEIETFFNEWKSPFRKKLITISEEDYPTLKKFLRNFPNSNHALKALSENLSKPSKIAPKTLFVYETKHLKGSEKIKFFYELKGRKDRNKEGILETTHSEFFDRSVVIAPKQTAKAMRDFLTRWKCKFEEMEVAESG